MENNLEHLKVGDKIFTKHVFYGYEIKTIIRGTSKYWFIKYNDVAEGKIKKSNGCLMGCEHHTQYHELTGENKNNIEWCFFQKKLINFEFDLKKITKENKEEIDTFIKKYGKGA